MKILTFLLYKIYIFFVDEQGKFTFESDYEI